MADASDRLKLGTDPIPGANPEGEKANYEPEFDEIKVEIAKLESIDKIKPNWKKVAANAGLLLATKSKDLFLGVWLTQGLLETEGHVGFTQGLTVCRDLLKNFGEKLLPTKSRARGSALGWLMERANEDFKEKEKRVPSEREKEPLNECLERLKDLHTISQEMLGDDAPAFGDVTRALQAKIAKIPKPRPKPDPNQPAAAQPEQAAGPVKKEIDSADSARAALNDIRKDMLKAATVLRKAKASDPEPYRLLREVSWWWDLKEEPQHTDGKANLPGPDGNLLIEFEKQLGDEEYDKVLEGAEAQIPNSPLWLDLNLYVYRAMEGLGKDYKKARTVIKEQVAALIARFPVVTQLSFANDIPLASEPTRVWIENEILRGDDSNEGSDNGMDQKLVAARKLVARKKLKEAADLLLKELQTVPHRRDRFLWRLNLAKLCMEGGKPDLAMPQLEALDDEIRKYSIEEWEPRLSAEVIGLLWKCCSGKSKVEGAKEKAQKLYERLCRLDMSTAMALNGKKK